MKPTARSVTRIRAAALAVAIAALAALATPASASALGFTNLSSAPASTQAGANSNFNLHIEFTAAGDDVKDLTIGLPPGQIADPTATPLCTVAQLNADTCPAASDVGDVTTVANVLGLPLPVSVPGDLYNLVPNAGEPARFGIVLRPVGGLLPKVILQSAVELRPAAFGLNTVIRDIPNTAGGLPIDITEMDVALVGTANGNPFSRNPTSCNLATTNFSANSYAAPGTTVTGQASYLPTACAGLPFSPTFSGKLGALGATAIGKKTPLSTVIEQDPGEAGLRQAAVTVPPEISPDASELFRACDLNVFLTGTCPPSASIGRAVASSPVLSQPLSGPVVLTTGPGLPQVGLALSGQLALKLIGELAPDGTTTFSGLPDIPISRFELSFDGPPAGLLLVGRNLCLPPTPTFRTAFTSYSGPLLQGSTAATIEGCGPQSGPRVNVKLTSAGSERPRMKVKVTAGSSDVRSVKLKLPKGLRLGSKGELKKGAKGVAGGEKLGPSAFRSKGRSLTVNGPTGGAGSIRFRVGSGALETARDLGRKLRFRATVRDIDATITKLSAKTRPRG